MMELAQRHFFYCKELWMTRHHNELVVAVCSVQFTASNKTMHSAEIHYALLHSWLVGLLCLRNICPVRYEK